MENESFLSKKSSRLPQINAEAAIVVSQADGKILLEKNSHKRLYPAFANKILSCILVLEKCNPDTMLTITRNTVDEIAKWKGSANIRLVENEEISIRDLLYAMMLVSANDAMFALADYVAGGMDLFAVMMDNKAKEIGANNTNIADENGKFSTEQFSTAVDMAIICRYAMFNKDFRKIVKSAAHTVPATNISKQRILHNTNYLISKNKFQKYFYKTAIGIKSGFSPRSKYCLAASALPPIGYFGEEVLVILLGADGNNTTITSFNDAKTLFDFTFKNYSKLSGKTPTGKVEKNKNALFTVSEICRALNVVKCTAPEMHITAIKKGDDNIVKNCAYISTANDARARQAIKMGAGVIICGKQIDDLPCIVVSYLDTAAELLANFIKTKSGVTSIGVLDSPMKINPIEMISLVIAEKDKVVKCTTIENNKSAIIRTLFSVDTNTKAAIMRIGLLDDGNVASVTRIANFDIAVLISVAASRNDRSQSKEEILEEKLEVFDNMSETGTVILNIDDPMLAGLYTIPQDIITIGVDNDAADYTADNIVIDGDKIEFDVNYMDESTRVELLTSERHIVYQVLVAFAVGKIMGFTNQRIRTGVERYKPTSGLCIHTIGTNIVMYDFENNDANSVISSIKTLCSTKPLGKGRRIAVFGDLMPSGSTSETFHKKLGEFVNHSNIDIFLCYGKNAKFIAEAADHTRHVIIALQSKQSLLEMLNLNIRHDDVILFKSMEAMGLDRVIKEIF